MSALNVNHQKVSLLSTINRIVDCLVNIRDESGEFLMTLPDGRVIDTKGWNDWEWTHGIGLYGLLKLHEITKEEGTLEIMKTWFRDRFEIGTTKNVNTMAPLLTAAFLHEAREGSYGVHLDAWGEWAINCDDTLMMTVLPLAKIGLVLDRPSYVEEAKRQFLLHIKYLQDHETGLWFHGWTFAGRHHFGRARWGRGNCWVTIAIPEFIEMLKLPESDGLRLFLVSSLMAQIDELVKYQDKETGLWHTIIDDPSSYLEASATAGFAYGIAKAIRLRLIPKEEQYVEAAKKAMQGVLANVSDQGELKQVSFGTPVFDDIESYKQIKLTSMPYGQSLALLALTEQLRAML